MRLRLISFIDLLADHIDVRGQQTWARKTSEINRSMYIGTYNDCGWGTERVLVGLEDGEGDRFCILGTCRRKDTLIGRCIG